jgi:hypothetical protein
MIVQLYIINENLCFPSNIEYLTNRGLLYPRDLLFGDILLNMENISINSIDVKRFENGDEMNFEAIFLDKK